MNKEELRIGNWVNCSELVDEDRIRQIRCFDFANYLDTNPDYYEPIHLTKEWLLHFGWVWNERTNSFENNDTRMHLEYRKLNGSYTMFNYVLKAKIAERIWHVHQLQNLYFALTGNELTIKI